jgi:hypothetical protein
MGLGVGGNLPVDGALFLEFLPFASGNLLTMLSVWWPVGQLIGRLVFLPDMAYMTRILLNAYQSLRMGLYPQLQLRFDSPVLLYRGVGGSVLP